MDDPSSNGKSVEVVRTTEEWLPFVYAELRRLAACKIASESSEITLQPTALVHEAWLRLMGSGDGAWANQRHFFCAAAEAMRRILIDRARKRARVRHGGQIDRVDFDDCEISSPLPDDRLLALHDALNRLASLDARAAEVVKMRFFLGMTEEQVAGQLEVSVNTVERAWKVSRLWLYREMSKDS